MNQLDRLEDFPQDHRDELASHELVPLWPSLRGVLAPACPPAALSGPIRGQSMPLPINRIFCSGPNNHGRAGATPSMKGHTIDRGAIALEVSGDLICTGAADVALNSGAVE